MKKKQLTAALIAGVASVALAEAASAASVPIASLYPAVPTSAGTYSLTGTVTTILNVASTTETFVISDGTGSVINYSIPKATYTPTVGDNVSITATDSPYQGQPELTSTGYTETTNSTGNPVSPTVLTLPQFNAAGDGANYAVAPNADSLVTLDDVLIQGIATNASGYMQLGTNTAYTISDMSGNTSTLYTYKTYSADLAAVNTANAADVASSNQLYTGYVNITGYADVYYGGPEIYPLSIVSAGVPEPMSLGIVAAGAMGLLARRRRAV
jgi:hypothetical protein